MFELNSRMSTDYLVPLTETCREQPVVNSRFITTLTPALPLTKRGRS